MGLYCRFGIYTRSIKGLEPCPTSVLIPNFVASAGLTDLFHYPCHRSRLGQNDLGSIQSTRSKADPKSARNSLIMLMCFNRIKQDTVISKAITENSVQCPVEAKTVCMRGDKPSIILQCLLGAFRVVIEKLAVSMTLTQEQAAYCIGACRFHRVTTMEGCRLQSL